MRLLGYVDFTKVTSVKTLLHSNPPYWVYVTVNGKTHNPTDLEDPEIYSRVFLENGVLAVYRRAQETKDASLSGLNPRVEVIPRTLLPRNVPLHIRYEMSPVTNSNFHGEILQIMDHTNSGATFPVFQFDIRDNKLHARGFTTIVNDKAGGIIINPIGDIVWGGSKWYNLDIFMISSSDSSKGIIRVYLDNQFVWERKAMTGTSWHEDPKIQFGVYANPGDDLKIHVRKLLWEVLDSIPTSSAISGYDVPHGTSPPPTGGATGHTGGTDSTGSSGHTGGTGSSGGTGPSQPPSTTVYTIEYPFTANHVEITTFCTRGSLKIDLTHKKIIYTTNTDVGDYFVYKDVDTGVLYPINVVINKQLTNLYIYDVSTNKPLKQLEAKEDLSNYKNFTFVYKNSNRPQGKCEFYFNGQLVHTESNEPLSISGDTSSGLNPYSIVSGNNVVKVRVYDSNNQLFEENSVNYLYNTPLMDSSYIVILAIGQSNMVGAGGSDPNNKLVSSEYNSKVSWYDYKNHRFSTNTVMSFQTTTSSCSPAKFCADKLIPLGKRIIIVPMAQSGTSTDQWAPGKSIFNNTVNCCKELFSKIPLLKLDLVLWLQGESDRNKPSGYADRVKNIMTHLRQNIPQWTDQTMLECGEISSKVLNANLINAEIHKLPSMLPSTSVVENSELAVASDNMHFITPSYLQIGKLFGEKYLSFH